MKDYYRILEVETTATQADIQASWRFSAKAFHPDRYNDQATKDRATAKMQAVNEAYAVLGDPDKRRQYDAEIAAEAQAAAEEQRQYSQQGAEERRRNAEREQQQEEAARRQEEQQEEAHQGEKYWNKKEGRWQNDEEAAETTAEGSRQRMEAAFRAMKVGNILWFLNPDLAFTFILIHCVPNAVVGFCERYILPFLIRHGFRKYAKITNFWERHISSMVARAGMALCLVAILFPYPIGAIFAIPGFVCAVIGTVQLIRKKGRGLWSSAIGLLIGGAYVFCMSVEYWEMPHSQSAQTGKISKQATQNGSPRYWVDDKNNIYDFGADGHRPKDPQPICEGIVEPNGTLRFGKKTHEFTLMFKKRAGTVDDYRMTATITDIASGQTIEGDYSVLTDKDANGNVYAEHRIITIGSAKMTLNPIDQGSYGAGGTRGAATPAAQPTYSAPPVARPSQPAQAPAASSYAPQNAVAAQQATPVQSTVSGQPTVRNSSDWAPAAPARQSAPAAQQPSGNANGYVPVYSFQPSGNAAQLPSASSSGYAAPQSEPQYEPMHSAPQQQRAAAQAPATSRPRYRMSEAEIRRQAAVCGPIIENAKLAAGRGDPQALNKCMARLSRDYPNCPSTIFLRMLIAFISRDFEGATAFYNILMTEYPDVDNIRRVYTQVYNAQMQQANAGR